MKALHACLLIVAAVCVTSENQTEDAKPKRTAKSPINEEKGVLILKKGNFDQALKQYKQLLVSFQAPLTPDFHRLMMEFTKAAAQLKTEASKIRLGSVDVSQEKELAKELNVTASPFLRFYVSGDKQNPIICPVLRSADHIITWLKRRTGHSAEVIKNTTQAETFLLGDDLVVIGFFKELDKGTVEVFYDAATDIPDLPFGVTKSKNIFAKYEIVKETIVLFKKSKKSEEYEISSHTSKEDLVQFIRMHEMDLVTEFNGTTSARILNSVINNHAILFANKSEEHYEEIYMAFERTAAEFKGKVLFVLMNTNEHRNGRMLEYFRVRAVETPMVRIVNMTDSVQYQMQSGDITTENVRAHCLHYLAGKAKAKLQSEPIPKNWDKKPVKELVGMNFEKVAFNEKKNVFIMFYTPWCKECQAFFPLWEKLGKVYENHESLVVARIDTTANDINIIFLERNPSFKFFPAVHSEKVIPYSGERTLEEFITFVEGQVELAKDVKAREETDWDKFIEEQKLKETVKVEL
ncbi:protein disulfide-isomerase [Paramormyrops kingsleyae]|uniref:protein disulfide-isomerase n=1 Tax=Paramormyrops kingsleyae TaxID=1676925 RepID=A0A3B3SNJ4_9TELE|nr:protein disulfide-isomerase-like [Paramormyrops kingsleyae]